MLWSTKLNKTTFFHPFEEKAIERKPFVEVISCVYVRDDFFFSYLTDFSYFLLEKNTKIAGHGLKMSKMEVWKGGEDGFSYFH
jgi:hypothetical protein